MKSKEEIEQLANEYTGGMDLNPTSYSAFIDGYTQCQEDMTKDVEYWQGEFDHWHKQAMDMTEMKYTKDDIDEMALDFIINTGGLPQTIEDWKTALWKFYEQLKKQN